jgi:hypothetical protein
VNLRVLFGIVLALALLGGGGYFLTMDRTAETPPLVEAAPATPPESGPAAAPSVPDSPSSTPLLPVAVELGAVRVDSDVPGAQVFLDRRFVGPTPLMLEEVALGGHQLTVSAEGFDVFAETLDVEPGPRDVLVNFLEVRLDAAIDVVHDHRFGSCQGRLVATVDGLRYETDDENDAFAVSFDALERFEVDYLETNLAVRPRNGRTFNFTDPGGDADTLFVFHRNVDEARARLASPAPAE